MNQRQGEKQHGKINPLMRAVALVGGPVVGFTIAYLLTRPAAPRAPEPRLEGVAFLAEVLGSLLAGGLLIALAAVFYLMVVFTGCFTANYRRPVFKKIKPRLFAANIVLAILLVLGIGLFLNGVLQLVFRLLGVGFSPWVVAIVIAALTVNVGLVRFHAWAPFEPKLATRRLLAAGLPPADVGRGLCIGISDPQVSGWKKAILEDDVGMLWLEPDRLVYRGDGDSFEIRREDLLAIDRVVVAASTTAYSGNRHIVLRFRTGAGRERGARLHVQGFWTPGRVTTATDQLADRLTAWWGAVNGVA